MQHYSVHIIMNDKLAGKAAVILACTGELKHIGLAFFRWWYRFHPGLVTECMAGCATAGTAAISLDAGNHGIHGGLHHGLAHFTDDGVLSAVMFDQCYFWHCFSPGNGFRPQQA